MYPNFFQGCSGSSEVKSLYRKLAMQHHPDRGGDTATMQEVNRQYELALKNLHGTYERGSDGEEHVYYYDEAHEKAIMAKLAELLKLKLPGCEILLIGKWIWVQGNTRPVKDLLGYNGAKMKWHSKRMAWFWKPYEWSTGYNPTVTLDDLADTYGCRIFTTQGTSAADAALAAV